jgi:hypothetical protein
MVVTGSRWRLTLPPLAFAALLLGAGLGTALLALRSEMPEWLGSSIFFLVPGIVLLILPLLFRPPVLRVAAGGIRAKKPMRRELLVPWPAVRGARGATAANGLVVGLLVVDLHPEFFRQPGARRWASAGLYSNSLTVRMPLAEITDALEGLSPYVPTTTPRSWSRGTVRLAVSAGAMSLLCSLLISFMFSVGMVLTPLPAHDVEAAPISQSPCGLVARATLALLVPAGKSDSNVSRGSTSSRNEWQCTVENTDRQHRGYLLVGLTRFGGVADRSPVVLARESFSVTKEVNVDRPEPDGRYLAIAGLGDEAVGRVETSLPTEYAATISVRRGSDVLLVQYRADPTTSDLSLKAAVAVTREILARLV